MAEVAKGIIDIEINTGSAASQLQALQSQINAFNLALNKSNKAQGTFAAEYSRELQSAINKTGLFTAETVKLQTAAATLDKTLSKGKTSLGQFFSAKFNKDSAIAAETMALAAERAKRLQTQFIATSGAANGMQEAMAVRPLAAFSSELSVAAQRTQILSNMFKQGTTQLINFGKNVQWAGRQLMVGFTVPLSIFGAMAGKTFMDLEKQMVSFRKVYGDITTTTADTNKNLEAVKGLAAEYTKYGIAVKDTIGLAAQAAAAGRKDADLKDAVSQATRLATLGQMDQNAALETTISLQSAFRLSGQDLADTINFLNMVENQTVVSLQDIAAAIPRVAPVIQGLGGNVKDLTVFLAAMQEGGVDAAEGANALKSGLASLINPTKQATEMLSGMGINLQAIIQANKGNLMGTVQSFAQALSSLDQFSRQQALEQVFGKFQYAKLGALFDNISRKGSQAQQVIETMGYTTEQLGATADKELKTIEESFGVKLTGAVERFKLAIAPIGQLFVQLAIPVVNFITKIVEGFNSLSDGQKRFAAIGAVIVGVVIPALTMMAGLFLNLVGTLAKLSQGIALFGKGFISGGPIGAFKALTQSSKYLSLAEMDAAMAAQQLSGASQVLNTALIEQVGTANAAAAAIANLTKAYSSMIATQGAAANLPNFGVAGAAGQAAKEGKTGGIRIRGLRRNSGGGVPGVGNTDTVPAMLTPGEFVINKEATKNNLGLLKAINDGKVQGLNKGGIANGVQYLNRGAIVSQARNILNIVGKRNGAIGTLDDFIKNIKDPELKAFLERYGSIRRAGSVPSSGATSKNNFVYRLPTSDNQSLLKSGVEGDSLVKRMLSNESLGSLIATAEKSGAPFDILAYRKAIGKRHQKIKSENSGKEVRYVDDLQNEATQAAIKNNPDIKFLPISSLHTPEVLGIIDPKHREFLRRTIGNETLKRFRKPSASTDAGKVFLRKEYLQKDTLPGAGDVVKFADSQSLKNPYTGPTRALQPGDKIMYRDTGKIVEWNGSSWIDTGKTARKAASDTKRQYASITEERFGRNRKTQYTHVPGLALAQGGPVPGSGNKDTVPAMLTPGEFVVNKKAASQNQNLLKMMNGGEVQKFGIGGLVGKAAGALPMVGGLAAFGAGQQSASKLGIDNEIAQLAAGMAASSAAEKVLRKSLFKFGLVTEEAASKTGLVSRGLTRFIPALGNTIPVLTKFAGPAGFIISAGIALKALGDSVEDSKKASVELTNAMYGSAERTKAMGDAFGRETFANASKKASVEAAIKSQISPEAQQASSEFMKTDAAKQMLADIETIKKSGGDAALAIRNQLASSIIAGVISPEEAAAIANDLGMALNDRGLSVRIAGSLTKLIGKNGEDLLENAATINAEITPKIDQQQFASAAQQAYDKMNPFQKMQKAFFGGEEAYKQESQVAQIANVNAQALQKEAEARSLLNLAFQEGTITLEEYNAQILNINTSNKQMQIDVEKARASALGFGSAEALNNSAQAYQNRQNALNTNINQQTGKPLTEAERKALLDQGYFDNLGKKALESLSQNKDAFNKQLIDMGMDETLASQITKGIQDSFSSSQVAESSQLFGKILSGEISVQGGQAVSKMLSSGQIDTTMIDSVANKLSFIENIPNITKNVQIEALGEVELSGLYSIAQQIESFPDPITKQVLFETLGFDLTAEQVNQFMALDPVTQKDLVYNFRVTLTETTVKNAEQYTGGNIDVYNKARLQADKKANDKAMSDFKNSIGDAFKGLGSTGTTGGGGGGGKSGVQSLKDYIKEFEKATKAKIKYFNATKGMLGAEDQEILALIDTEMYLKANAKQREHLLSLAKDQLNIQKATAFLALSSQEKELQGLDAISKALDIKSQKDNAALRVQQRNLELNNRALDKLTEKEDEVNKQYDLRIEALDKVEKANNRLAEQDRSRVDLASALASGDIAAAANAANTMQQQSAQYQIEDARAALEAKRQEELKNLTVSVNGVLMTRAQIEASNKTIQDQILVIEDALYKIEDERFKNAQEREKLELAIYLLQQKQNIEALRAQGLSGAQLSNLQALIDQYNAVAAAAQAAGVQTPGQAANTSVGAGNGTYTNPAPIDTSGASTSGPAAPATQAGVIPGDSLFNKMIEMYEKLSAADKTQFHEIVDIGPGSGYATWKAKRASNDITNGNLNFVIDKILNNGKIGAQDMSEDGQVSFKKHFGGMIPGKGIADTVKGMLTPGEFVVNKESSRKFRPILEGINNGFFPGMNKPSVPTNNFLEGIGSPRYSIPEQNMGAIPVNNVSSSQASSMYNSTYNVNVNVSGTNASPDDIANVVMAKLSQQNRGNLRSNRY